MFSGTLNQTDKGRLWRSTNGTPGTGFVIPSGIAFNSATAFFMLSNNGTLGKTLVLEYVKLIVTANNMLGSTSAEAACFLDSKLRGGTTDTNASKTPGDTDALGATTDAVVRCGVISGLTGITSKAKLLMRSTVKVQAAPTLTVGDEIVFIFNEDMQGLGPTNGSAPARYVVPTGLASVDPGHTITLHMWYPNATSGGPTVEYEASWYEKQ